MPKTKSAKKALRKSLRKKKINDLRRTLIHKAIVAFRKAIKMQDINEAEKCLQELYKQVDKAAKRFLHKNKAARIKSRYASMLQQLKDKLNK